MGYPQVYYTSCVTGLRNSRGFQINAATAGIDSRILDQVERLGVYVPPVSMPSRPTEEELQTFPISLIYDDLGAGQKLLAQAVYLGKDYSGRYGNFFTHSLIVRPGDLANQGLIPISLWRSSNWTTTESTETTLPELPAPMPAGVLTLERAIAAIRQRGQTDKIPAMLSFVEQALTSKRRIIVVGDSETVATWIALATCALPISLATRITFNTYLKNPYQSSVIIAGVRSRTDTDFAFSAHELSSQFFLFDGISGEQTPTSLTPWARMTADAFRAQDLNLIQEFIDFADRVAPDLDPADLPTALAIFALQTGEAVSAGDELKLLRWSADRLENLDASAVSKMITQALRLGIDQPRLEAVAAIIRRSGTDHDLCDQASHAFWSGLGNQSSGMAQLEPILKSWPIAEAVTLSESIQAQHRKTLDLLIRRQQEGTAKAQLIRLGLRFRLLDDHPDLQRVIGCQELPALLEKGVTPPYLDEMPGRVLEGVIRGLESLLQSIDKKPQWLDKLLQMTRVADQLEHIAVSAGHVRVMALIAASRPAATDEARWEHFTGLIAELDGMPGRNAHDDFDLASQAFWSTVRPKIKDLRRLWQHYRPIFRQHKSREWLAEQILNLTDLRKVDDETYQLANEIAQEGEGAPPGAYLVILGHDIDKMSSIGDQINQFPQIAERISDKQFRDFASLLSGRVLRKGNTDEHIRLLQTIGSYWRQVGNAYIDQVITTLRGTKVSPKTIAEWFNAWSRVEAVGERLIWDQAVADVIMENVSSLKQVEVALKNTSKAAANWKKWRNYYLGQPFNILDYKKDILIVTTFLALILVVGSAGYIGYGLFYSTNGNTASKPVASQSDQWYSSILAWLGLVPTSAKAGNGNRPDSPTPAPQASATVKPVEPSAPMSHSPNPSAQSSGN